MMPKIDINDLNRQAVMYAKGSMPSVVPTLREALIAIHRMPVPMRQKMVVKNERNQAFVYDDFKEWLAD